MKLYLTKERGGEFSGVGTMKETILQDLNKRLGSITDNKNYYLASILDPRFKLAFFNANEKENAKEKIISTMEINKKVETDTNSESEMTTFEDAKKNQKNQAYHCGTVLLKSQTLSQIQNSLIIHQQKN